MDPFRKDKILLAVILFLLWLLGSYNYLTGFEKNYCEMTYMYEYPEYIPIKLPASVISKFPRYNLYIYGEGTYAQALSRQNKLLGIPVLFIPGNAGSYKQVRSLASVSYQKSKNTVAVFNYFTVDLNEEYSGLYGGILQDQTKFVEACIKHILSLYKSSRAPVSSVILVGHSMGGMIARALFSLPNFDPTTISIILTQATPHQPIALFDLQMRKFYRDVSNNWRSNRHSSLKNINFVSIGGGHRDTLVRSSLAFLPQEQNYVYDIQLLTSAIPGVWLSNDHNSIVWCKQLVLTTIRALFALVDPSSKQIMSDVSKRADILHYYFVRQSSQLPYHVFSKYKDSVSLNPNAIWNEQRKSSWSYIQSKIVALTYLAIPIRRDGILLVVAKNVPEVQWFFTCKADAVSSQQPCVVGDVISDIRRLPSSDKSEKLMATINLNDWRMATHAVIQVEPSQSQVEVYAEVYDPVDRNLVFKVPYLIFGLIYKYPLVGQTAKNAIFYNISMNGFHYLWQAYGITIKSSGKNCKREDTAIMRFYVPWNSEDIYSYVRPKSLSYYVVKLQSPSYDSNIVPQLHFYLDPQCSYQIVLSTSLSDVMGQIIRYYGFIFPVLIVAVLSETLAHQVSHYHKSGVCPPLGTALSMKRGILTVVIPAYFILFVTRNEEVISFFPFLPKLQDYPLETRFIHFTPILAVLYVLIVALIHIIRWSFRIPIIVIGYSFSYFLYRYKQKEPGALSERNQLLSFGPSIISAALVACAYSLCGSIVLIAGFFFYLIKVGYLQGKLEHAENRGRDTSILSRAAHTHDTLFLLWWLMCVLTAPSLSAWMKNLKFGTQLNPDPSLFPAVILLASLAFFWNDEGIHIKKMPSPTVSWVLQFISFTVLCCGLNVLYFTVIFICLIFIAVDVLLATSIKSENIFSVGFNDKPIS